MLERRNEPLLSLDLDTWEEEIADGKKHALGYDVTEALKEEFWEVFTERVRAGNSIDYMFNTDYLKVSIDHLAMKAKNKYPSLYAMKEFPEILLQGCEGFSILYTDIEETIKWWKKRWLSDSTKAAKKVAGNAIKMRR